ncbi:hypothetical protein [Streptomyces sp. 6N223]|uniref:hypothetical protein n=1 Tax=Streptomyces sp. 6N223 TaxID=3457412 RepID=UPI003FD5C6D2
MPGYMRAYRERLAAAAGRLATVSLECLPALDLGAKYGRGVDVLLYVDPQILGSTRPPSNHRVEMAGEDDHRHLEAALHACRAAVVLSGYDSPLYAELYGGWHRAERSTVTGKAQGAKGRVEVQWSNRPAALLPRAAAYTGRELGPLPAVLGEIAAEHERQDGRWGEQNHPDGTGLQGDEGQAIIARR